MADKKTLRHLEHLFAAEVEGREIQLHKATAERLHKLGYIEPVEHQSRDRLGTFTWTTHVLTHLGRYTYCQTCDDDEDLP